MIPHLGPNPRQSRPVLTASGFLTMVLRAMGCPPLGFRVKPDLGEYKLAEPIEPARKPAPFEVLRRERGGKRVDPVAERKRLRAAV